MSDEHSLGGFIIVCRKCEERNHSSHTCLHINWEKRYYVMLCDDCGATEVFNELAERITDKIQGLKQENEQKKQKSSA